MEMRHWREQKSRCGNWTFVSSPIRARSVELHPGPFPDDKLATVYTDKDGRFSIEVSRNSKINGSFDTVSG